MPYALAYLMSQALTTSSACAARPATTFLVLQLVLYGQTTLVPWWTGEPWFVMAPSLAWVLNPVVIVFVALLTAVEWTAVHSEDVERMVRQVHADKMAAGFGAFAGVLLMANLHVAHDDVARGQAEAEVRVQQMSGEEVRTEPIVAPTGVVTTEQRQEEAQATQVVTAVKDATESGTPWTHQLLAVGVALILAPGLSWLRGQFWDLVGDFVPRWMKWVETGGVIGVLALLPLAPFLVAALVVLFTIAGVALWATIAVAARARDAAARRPCPAGCGASIRQEATRCPSCQAAVPPAAWLRPGTLGNVVTEPTSEPSAGAPVSG